MTWKASLGVEVVEEPQLPFKDLQPVPASVWAEISSKDNASVAKVTNQQMEVKMLTLSTTVSFSHMSNVLPEKLLISLEHPVCLNLHIVHLNVKVKVMEQEFISNKLENVSAQLLEIMTQHVRLQAAQQEIMLSMIVMEKSLCTILQTLLSLLHMTHLPFQESSETFLVREKIVDVFQNPFYSVENNSSTTLVKALLLQD